MGKEHKITVEIFSQDNDPTPYNGNLPDLEEYFNKTQIIPRIGETVYFDNKSVEIAVSKPEDKDGFTTETIRARINTLYATVTSVQYNAYNQRVQIIVKPNDIGYEKLK